MRPRRLLATAGLIGVLLGGCGGGNSSGVSASKYVNTVCQSVATWLSAVRNSQSALPTQLGPSSSPAQGKRVLSSFLAGVVSDTDAVVTKLRAAGVPKVSGGQQISNAFINSFTRARNILQASQTQVSQLPTTSASAFRNATQQLSTTLQQSLSSIGTSLASLHSPELEKDAASSAACKSLSAA